MFYFFFWLVASSLDEHLGRGIRHDDVYEELAPTTYCKTNKKTHSHSPPLSSFSSLWLHSNRRSYIAFVSLIHRNHDIHTDFDLNTTIGDRIQVAPDRKERRMELYHLHIQTEPNFADGLVHKPLQQKMVSGLDCCLSILCKKTNTHNSW